MSVIFKFDRYQLDTARRLLLRDGTPVEVSSAAFETLLALVQSPGQILTKQELIERVWRGTAVEDNNLAQCISSLRRVLGEGPQDRKFISTVPGRGYIFSAALETPDNPSSQQRTPHVLRAGRHFAWLLMLCIALGSVGLLLTIGRRVPAEDCIAVLPFQISGPSANDPGLGLMLSDAVTSELVNIQRLRVRPTAVVSRFRASGKYPTTSEEMLATGKALKVNKLLVASVILHNDSAEITTQLIDVNRNAAIWADRFDTPFQATLASQDLVASRIASGVSRVLFR